MDHHPQPDPIAHPIRDKIMHVMNANLTFVAMVQKLESYVTREKHISYNEGYQAAKEKYEAKD